jgi:hypothetical protein
MGKLEVFIVSLMVFIFIFAFCLAIYYSVNKDNERMEGTCEDIADKLDYKVYYYGRGKCGFGEACSFQCGFIDSEGGTITKNIP